MEAHKFKGKFISLSSWVNIDGNINAVDEVFSLSLRAKLLYGKHLFEDLLNHEDFGSEEQIINVLYLCEQQGSLVIHQELHDLKTNVGNVKKNNKIKKEKPFRGMLYRKLQSWLR